MGLRVCVAHHGERRSGWRSGAAGKIEEEYVACGALEMGKNARKKALRQAQGTMPAAYREWLREKVVSHEGMATNVEIQETESSGRGIRTTKAVAPGEVFLAVREHVFITRQRALAMPVGVVLRDDEVMGHLREDEDTALVLALIADRQSAEPLWGEHYNFMPSSYDSVLVWDAEELAELRGSNVRQWAQRVHVQVAQDWAQVAPAAEKYKEIFPEGLSMLDYVWAVQSVWSRAFDLDLGETAADDRAATGAARHAKNGRATTRCLVPFADLLNHDATKTVLHFFNPVTKCLEFQAESASFPAGAELVTNYGVLPNSKLIRLYGFSLGAANPVPECVEIYITFPPDTHALLELRGINPQAPHVLWGGQPLPEALVEACTIRRDGNELIGLNDLYTALNAMVAAYDDEELDSQDTAPKSNRVAWARELCTAEVVVLGEHLSQIRQRMLDLGATIAPQGT